MSGRCSTVAISAPILIRPIYSQGAFIVKSRLLFAALALGAMFSLPPGATAASASQVAGADVIRSIANAKGHVRVIARLKAAPMPEHAPGATHLAAAHAQIEGVMQAVRVRYVRRLPDVPLTVVEVDSSQLETLLGSGLVESVQEDHLSAPQLAQSIPLIRGEQAWNLGGRGQGQTVAILDTGVDSNHPYLFPRVVAEACFSTNFSFAGVASLCPNGQDSQVGAGAAAPCPINGCTHGTHVAGIAAARGSDFSGVAPDANIIAIQVYSSVSDTSPTSAPCRAAGRPSPCPLAYDSDIIRALQYVASQTASFHIASVNLSLGGGKYTAACDDSTVKPSIDNLRNLGVATVIAAGNNRFTDAVGSPGCISTAVTVGSTDKADAVSSFSNSAAMVDFWAPGDQITSTIPGGGSGIMSGTSMATPHVTGAYAAIRSAMPNATLDEIEGALAFSGRQITDTANNITHPRIFVGSAVCHLAGCRDHGNLIQSTWGTRGNFELVLVQGNAINHYIRDNDDAALPWKLVRTLSYATPPRTLGPHPKSATFIQSTFRSDGKHGNYELVARVRPAIASKPDYLDFWFFDGSTGNWNGPFPLIADGQQITGVTGDPVLIQSTWGATGNFELLVPQGDVINHYIRDNDDPSLPWRRVRTLSYRAPPNAIGPRPVGVTMIQSTFFGDGQHGNYELIVRMHPALASAPDYLDFWYLDSGSGQWNGPFPLIVNNAPVTGVTGDPQLIQGTWGTRGNFELLVPQGKNINQYYRDNDDPSLAWHLIRTVPYPHIGPLGPTPKDISFIQSNFNGDGEHGSFELVTRVAPSPTMQGTDYLDFWYFDSSTGKWNGAFHVLVGGNLVSGITGF
jgi:subtilisin family serine protease